MIDWLSIVENNKMIHTVDTDIVTDVVEIESFGMGFDEFDKETVSVDELKLGKNIENLNIKISKLNEELSDCEIDLYNYKRGLSQVEARLVEFKENEVKFCERIRVLGRDVEIRDNKIKYLKNELEQIKKEKESLDNKLTVHPPPAQIYSPHKKDLSWTGLPEFVDDTVTDYRRPTPSIDASKCKKSELQSSNFFVFEHGESTGSIMSKPMIKNISKGPKVRRNQRNWNNQKSQQLGNDFMMHNKACYICGSFDHLQYTCKQKRQLNGKREEKPVWNNAGRVNHQNSLRITHPNLKRNMVPRKILTRSGPISLNTARQSHLNVVCCCCSRQVNTARPKAVIKIVRTNRVNDVKASACWVWKSIKTNNSSITLKRYDYVDVRGRSRSVMAWVPKKGRIVRNKTLQDIPTASYGEPTASALCHCGRLSAPERIDLLARVVIKKSGNLDEIIVYSHSLEVWNPEYSVARVAGKEASIFEDVKVIKYMKKFLYDLTEVNSEMRAFMDELENLKCSGDAVKSVIFLNNSKAGCGESHGPYDNVGKCSRHTNIYTTRNT
nr:retrotransposon Orf1 [Tanacetum cinerariifolium]